MRRQSNNKSPVKWLTFKEWQDYKNWCESFVYLDHFVGHKQKYFRTFDGELVSIEDEKEAAKQTNKR